MYKKIIDEAIQEAKTVRSVAGPLGCFVAGTLVHTHDGVVPIENIRPGDLVLSQPEGKGELSYKRVVNTFCFEDKEVYEIRFCAKEVEDEAIKNKKTIDPAKFHYLVATGNHPFWVKDVGWTRADCLEINHLLELANGEIAVVYGVKAIYETATEGVGWTQMGFDADEGWLIDLRNGKILPEPNPYHTVENEGVDWWKDGHRLKRTVYDLEVKDNHTYYVSELGVWVHNTDCVGDVGRVLEAL